MTSRSINSIGVSLLKWLLLFLPFVNLLSCGGVGRIRENQTSGKLGEIRSSTSGDQIKEMRYFPPIYSKQKPEFTISRMHFSFITATTRRLDSIFEVSAEKYRISGKISEPNLREAQRIYSNIGLVFREIDSNKNVRDIRIPMAIRSVLKKEHSRFALAMLISPDFSTREQTSPNAIGLIRKEKRENSYLVKSGTIHVLIFDLENNNIAFYRKRSGVRYLGYGYWNTFLEDSLTEIFSFYFF